jgi:Flp pilus assembly protein TadG
MIRKSAIWRSGSGAATVEMALTLSLLLFLILGAIQFGLVFWQWNTMLLAVEEAGRYAMLYNPTSLASANLTLAQVCPGGVATVSLANCAVAWANQNGGSNVTLTCTSGCAAGSATMTFTATSTFNFITSFSLSRAIEVPAI